MLRARGKKTMKAATATVNDPLTLFIIHLARLKERVAWPPKGITRTQSHELR